jgi:two-component system, chemotaxis family, protein-glutamate methylesterase/glutaminase
MTSPKIRVLVVEDSLTVRRRLVDVVEGDPELELAGEAEDGKRAIELVQRLRPDVVTLDMMMPVMTGLAATEWIMAYCPTPILIVSASTNRGELFRTYDALAAGAVDVLEKPRSDEAPGTWEAQFAARVKMVSRIRVITHPRVRLERVRRAAALSLDAGSGAGEGRCRAIAIGASTGGPAALLRILGALPASFSVPVLLVIHIGAAFGTALADWLDGQSPLRVSFASDGDALPPEGEGRILMAPADRHLVVEGSRIRLSDGPERHSCRPSVDVLFESVARAIGPRSAACLLTGMGRDGAEGLLAIRRAGGVTLAQDEETSVVYGMPKEAALLGAAERILPLDAIAPALQAIAGGERRSA